MENKVMNKSNNKGEYYVEKDDDTNDWCIFHTEYTKAHGSYSSQNDAQAACDNLNKK